MKKERRGWSAEDKTQSSIYIFKIEQSFDRRSLPRIKIKPTNTIRPTIVKATIGNIAGSGVRGVTCTENPRNSYR